MSGKNKHFKYEDRVVIQQSLKEKLSFKAIGKLLNKDCTSVSREIRRHVVTTYTGTWGKVFIDCIHRDKCLISNLCNNESCTRPICKGCREHCNSEDCPSYKKEICSNLEKPPYVCTGCSSYNTCKLPKIIYNADVADRVYRNQLKELRNGVTISEEEASKLAVIFKEGTKKGQSIHHIVTANGGEDTIGYSEKTIYNYIALGVIPGVINLDLPRKVSYKKRKKNSNQYIKVDKSCRVGRTYDDYLAFMKEGNNIYLPVVEMDSVEGKKGIGEKVCLTLLFTSCTMMFGFLRDSNSSSSVIAIFNKLKITLGEDLFSKLFPVILTDRGTEFSDPRAIEMSLDGKRQLTHVFYCDPMNSNQKPEVERCHADFRRIVPKGTSLNSFSQDDIQKAFGHVAAIPRQQYFDKTASQLFITIYGEDTFNKLGGVLVSPKDANLTPKLLAK